MNKRANWLSFLYLKGKSNVLSILMRAFVLFLFFGFTSVHANDSYSNTKLNISLTNGTLAALFDQIHAQSEFIFLYNDVTITEAEKVTLNLQQATVSKILDEAFSNTKLVHKISDRQIVVSRKHTQTATKTIAKPVNEVQDTVTGTVTSDGVPLPGASVIIKGTSKGTQTDFDGNFELDATNGDILVISYVGFTTQEVIYSGQTILNVALEENAAALDAVVVVGYGVKKKSLVTGAISSIDSKQIENSSNQRVEQALQGRTSGVTVVSSSGAPGSAAKVRIRGAGSNGNSDPLYIVDGLKVSGIESIAPNDIANIEVLKDAASAAIYGTEGANGVIIITTKQGKLGDSRFSYNTQIGFESVKSKMELMNAPQFVQYMQEAGQVGVVDNGIDTNWIDNTFSDAFFQRHDLSFSGASEKTSYYISGSLLDQDGIVGGGNSSFTRYSFRTNVKSDIKDWLEVGANISYTNSINKGIPENSDTRGVIQNMLIIDPLTPVVYEGATPQNVLDNADANNVPLLTDNNGNVYGYPSFSSGEVLNPVAYANRIANSTDDDDRFIGSTYATLKLTDDLSFTTRMGIERSNSFNKSISTPYYVSSEALNLNYGVTETIERNTKWLWENFATYSKSIGNNNFALLVGYSSEETKNPNIVASATESVSDFTSPYLDFLSNIGNVGGTLFKDNLVSAFGRLSYSYLDKYLLEGSLRYDESDKFPSAKKGAYFPAVSAGWVVSKENFWKESSALDYLKLRGSWGQNGSKRNLDGNSDLVYFLNQVETGGPITYQDFLGIQSAFIVNPDLTWEISEQLDLGIDLRAFDRRLNFTTDYYVKTTKDLIVTDGSLISTPSAGGQIKEFNGGTIRNKGFEFELGWNDSNDNGFSYGINLNLSTLDNEVTEISGVPEGANIRGADAPQNGDGITRFQEGFPVWYFYGYQTDGIDPATGEIVLVDTDGEDGITNNDKTIIGSPHPDLIFGGNLDFGYKGLDFNIRFQGTSGNDIISTYHQPTRPVANKSVHWFDNRWTSANTNASFPSAEFATSAYQTDLVVEDGSYMRIKQIQLGYSLPTNLLSKVNLKKVRVYVSLDDYFTFTKYKGLDPETGGDDDNALGVDKGFYPISAKALLGLSLEF